MIGLRNELKHLETHLRPGSGSTVSSMKLGMVSRLGAGAAESRHLQHCSDGLREGWPLGRGAAPAAADADEAD